MSDQQEGGSEWTVEPREGVKVFVGDEGHVVLTQENLRDRSDDSIILLDPKDVPQVIEHLQEALEATGGEELVVHKKRTIHHPSETPSKPA